MEKRKILHLLLVLAILISVLPASSLRVFAADVPTEFTINGWKLHFSEEGESGDPVSKVLINGEELPEDGSMTFGPDDWLEIEVFFKEGWTISYYVEVPICLCALSEYDPDDPYAHYNLVNAKSDSAYTTMQMPPEDELEKFSQTYLLIPVRKMTEEELEYYITSVDLTIEAPLCGTVVTAEVSEMDDPEYPTVKAGTDGDDKAPVNYYWDTQDPYPAVTIPEDADYELAETDTYLYGYWVVFSKDPDEGYITGEDLYVNDDKNPMMKGGDTIIAEICINAKEEHVFTYPLNINITGGKLEDYDVFEDEMLILHVSVEVEHVPGEPEEEEGEDPTCLEDGYHFEVTCCEKCGEKLKHEKVTDPALGHDWGEWKVTKEPTDDEKGEETRICKRDPSHIETRPLDKDSESPDTSDSGRIVLWSALSAASLASLAWLDKERRKYTCTK